MKSSTESATSPLDWLQKGVAITTIFFTTLAPGVSSSIQTSPFLPFSISSTPINAPMTTSGRHQFYVKESDYSFTRRAHMRLQDITDMNQAQQVRAVLAGLEVAIGDVDSKALPNIHLAEIESTSTILIEWIFRDRRLVFNIETDPADSGWVFATRSGEIYLGDIENVDFAHLAEKSLEGFDA